MVRKKLSKNEEKMKTIFIRIFRNPEFHDALIESLRRVSKSNKEFELKSAQVRAKVYSKSFNVAFARYSNMIQQAIKESTDAKIAVIKIKKAK